MFLQVDKSYKDIMRKVNKVPLAIRAATQPGMVCSSPLGWGEVAWERWGGGCRGGVGVSNLVFYAQSREGGGGGMGSICGHELPFGGVGTHQSV